MLLASFLLLYYFFLNILFSSLLYVYKYIRSVNKRNCDENVAWGEEQLLSVQDIDVDHDLQISSKPRSNCRSSPCGEFSGILEEARDFTNRLELAESSMDFAIFCLDELFYE